MFVGALELKLCDFSSILSSNDLFHIHNFPMGIVSFAITIDVTKKVSSPGSTRLQGLV